MSYAGEPWRPDELETRIYDAIQGGGGSEAGAAINVLKKILNRLGKKKQGDLLRSQVDVPTTPAPQAGNSAGSLAPATPTTPMAVTSPADGCILIFDNFPATPSLEATPVAAPTNFRAPDTAARRSTRADSTPGNKGIKLTTGMVDAMVDSFPASGDADKEAAAGSADGIKAYWDQRSQLEAEQLEDQFNPTKAEKRAGGYLNPPAKYLKHYNAGSSNLDTGRDQWDEQMKDLPREEITRLTTAWKALQKQTAAATKAQGNVDEDDYGKSPVNTQMEVEVTRKRARTRETNRVTGQAASHVGAYNALEKELLRIESAMFDAVDRCRTKSNGVTRSTTMALLVETTVSPYPPPKNDSSEAETSYLVYTMSPEEIDRDHGNVLVHRTKSDMLDELLGIYDRLTEPAALERSIFAMPMETMSF